MSIEKAYFCFLGEVAAPSNEKVSDIKDDKLPYIGLEHMGTEAPTLIGKADSSYSSSANNVFHPGDVLFGKLRPYLRKCVGVDFSGYCSTDIIVLRPKDGVDPSFAAKVFQSDKVFREAARTSFGTKMPRTSWSQLSQLRVFFPSPEEQRRIAEILDTLDETIRRTEQVIAKLQRMKQGLLHDLLTRGLDDNGELRDPERHPEQFKGSSLGRIPSDWAIEVLANIAEVRSGKAKNENKAVSRPIKVHYLRVANVQDGYLDLTEMNTLTISRDELDRYSVLPGDVLMNEGGDLDKLGRGCIWRGELSPCIHQNHVFVVRSGPKIDPDFLDVWTGGDIARRYFISVGIQTTNLASINKNALSNLPVLLPSLREQKLIVNATVTYQKRIDEEKVVLEKYRVIKSGLMSDLLAGRVRIPQAEAVLKQAM